MSQVMAAIGGATCSTEDRTPLQSPATSRWLLFANVHEIVCHQLLDSLPEASASLTPKAVVCVYVCVCVCGGGVLFPCSAWDSDFPLIL
jgi:hypothetical protein